MIISEVRVVDVGGPLEEAWFHLRRTVHDNPPPVNQEYSLGRLEIFRLKRSFIHQESYEPIRLLAESYGDVVCAGWWPLNFLDRHDNAFLSFLQKLSVLRIKDGISEDRFLARTPTDDYDKCHYCREAYQVMITPSSPWSEALVPWFTYMSDTGMDASRSHEYAHWFGHILSG